MSDEQFGPKPHPAYYLGDIVELRDGTVAIFIYYDEDSAFPCMGHAIGKSATYTWTLEGRYLVGIESDCDIVKKIRQRLACNFRAQNLYRKSRP